MGAEQEKPALIASPTQQVIRTYMDQINQPLHTIPFELWKIGEGMVFAGRATEEFVAIRWHPRHQRSGQMWFAPIGKYLELPRDFLLGSTGFPCNAEVIEEVSKTAAEISGDSVT